MDSSPQLSSAASTRALNADAAPSAAGTLGLPAGNPTVTPTTFSPVTFAAAVAACVIVTVVISLLIYIMRRMKWISATSGDLPNPQPSHRVWVRMGGNISAKAAASSGLDASLIQSFPVMIYNSENPSAGFTEKLVSRPVSQDASQRGQQANTVGSDASLANGTTDVNSESTRLAAQADKCAADPAHRHVVITLDEDNACLRECAVCLGDYDEGERIKLLPPCGHRFHVECIDLWLSSKSTCPICRKDLRPDTLLVGEPCEKLSQSDDSVRLDVVVVRRDGDEPREAQAAVAAVA